MLVLALGLAWTLVVVVTLVLLAAAGRGAGPAAPRAPGRHRPGSAAPAGAGAVAVTAVVMSMAGPGTATAHAKSSGAGCANAAAPAAAGRRNVEKVTLCLINQKRQRRGLRSLRRSGALEQAAIGHSRDMAQREYFAHKTLGRGDTFGKRIIAAGYASLRETWTLGENLAWGTGELATPAAIVEGWMRSPAHRATLLNRSFEDVGIGVVQDGPKTIYTTDYGQRG